MPGRKALKVRALRRLVAQAAPDDVIVYEGSLEYSPALPFYTGRRVLLVTRGI